MIAEKTCHPENAKATSRSTKTTSNSRYRSIYIDEPIYAQADLNDDGDFLDTGEKFYYVTNTQYSVTAILDTSGDILERYEYTPYGSVTIYTGDGGDGDWFDGDETTGALTGNHYLFTGRRLDPETGLYYFRNRYYSAELGRFVSRDPMGETGMTDVHLALGDFQEIRQFMEPALSQEIMALAIPVEYKDGMNLYQGYFVPNSMDPSGLISSIYQNLPNGCRCRRRSHLEYPCAPEGASCKDGGKCVTRVYGGGGSTRPPVWLCVCRKSTEVIRCRRKRWWYLWGEKRRCKDEKIEIWKVNNDKIEVWLEQDWDKCDPCCE